MSKTCLRGHNRRYSDGKCAECHNMFKRYRHSVRTVLKCKDANKVHKSVGYSRNELERHIESLFTNQMNWDNYGEVWQIDHIRSIKKFVDDGIEDKSIVNALDNLQPLLCEENLTKNWR